jgi:hypothetical protein
MAETKEGNETGGFKDLEFVGWYLVLQEKSLRSLRPLRETKLLDG